MASDPLALLRSRRYVGLLVLAGVIGVPISAAAWGFLQLVTTLQSQLFTHLPHAFGFRTEPMWWPLPLLTISGLLVALAIRYFPGTGGHLPAEGLKTGGIPVPVELPGIFFAALAGLALGAVIGPEAPLIALGGGLAVVAVKLAKRDAPDRTVTAVAAAGSFAAVSALLGSPILGAFLLMEAAGLGGIMMDLVLLPGLVASGTGALIFVGLGSWTGLGTNSLVIPNLPHFARPDAAEFGWAIVIGLGAAVVGAGVRWLGLYLQGRVKPRMIQLTPLVGLVVAGLAVAYAEATGKGTSDVLFSGQSALPTLLAHSATYSVGALVLLLACKGLAYGLSLSSFRGGPIFPSLFLGAAGGIALSHAPGLPMVAGAAMGMGALMVAMLRLPLTSVLLATLLLLSDGLAVMPLVIVAVAIAFVASSKISPVPPPAPPTPPATATPADEAVPASRT